MKTKLLFLTLLCAAFGASLFAQGGPLTPAASSTGSITGNSANCFAGVCVVLHMATSNVGFSVTVSGTWTGTLTVEQSGDNQATWTSVTTTTANTLFTSALTPGITDARVRGSAAMTGSALVTITASGPATIQNNIGSGSSSASSGASNAAPNMAFYFTNACQVANTNQCFFTPANTQLVNDCTWSNASTTLTCATSHFVLSDVGKRVAGYFKTDSFGSAFGCVAGRVSFSSMTTGTMTITGFTSGTSITLSGNPANTATGNNGCFIWGTPDDTAAASFETTYAAISSYCPKVMVAAAGYWFSSPHFASQPAGCAALATVFGASTTFGNMLLTAGFELEGRGPGNTVFYLGPDFPVAGGNLCTNAQGGITNACFMVPVEGKFTDFQISGGAQLACQVASGSALIGVTVGTLQNITLTNMCEVQTGSQVGILADSYAQLYQVNDSAFGATCFKTINNGVQAYKLMCEDNPGDNSGANTVNVTTGGVGLPPTLQCFGCVFAGAIATPGGGNTVLNLASGTVTRLFGGIITNCEAGAGCTAGGGTTLVRNAGGTLYMTDVTESAQGGATSVAGLFCSNSAGKSYLERTTLFNISNQDYTDVAGCSLFDLGGNTGLLTGTTSLSGTVTADSRSIMFSCTGVANASVTNSLYGSGPNITATTCAGQTATLGTGIPSQQARTIVGIICTSSATTVSVACTVMKNHLGAGLTAGSTTCTMTAATRCVNFTTTAIAAGDFLSAQIVTGAAETGANINMQVIWQ